MVIYGEVKGIFNVIIGGLTPEESEKQDRKNGYQSFHPVIVTEFRKKLSLLGRGN